MVEEKHALVKDVFALEENEQIFFEFTCSLSATASLPGRLYVTEHYLCFSANVFGIETKVSTLLPFLVTPSHLILYRFSEENRDRAHKKAQEGQANDDL